MKLALLAAALLFAAGSANATSNVVVVPAWTLSGYQVVKSINSSAQSIYPVKITNFSTEADCEEAKVKQNTELATPGTSTAAGTIQATDSIFTGSCIKVKEFVFAPNLF
jgi:hypothetical protein